MIHSTSTMITPMTIQVTAVDDMKWLLGRFFAGAIYGAAGAKGSGARRGAAERAGAQIVALSGRARAGRPQSILLHEARMTVSMPVTAPAPANPVIVATDIPARLDRLRWGRFHTLVVVALGITWILDGLEVTLA